VQEINKRRRELCSYKYRGFSLDNIAEILSKKYGVKDSTIKKDWYTRVDWIKYVFDFELENPELLFLDIVAEQKEVRRELYRVFKDSENESIKLGALKQIDANIGNIYNMLSQSGVIEKAVQKVELSADVEVKDVKAIRENFLDEIEKLSNKEKKENDSSEK